MSHIHIHAPMPEATMIQREYCPTCDRRRFMLCRFVEWYGWGVTCLRCGERWEDGEMLPRPFKPRWRKENVERAKAYWRAVRRKVVRS